MSSFCSSQTGSCSSLMHQATFYLWTDFSLFVEIILSEILYLKSHSGKSHHPSLSSMSHAFVLHVFTASFSPGAQTRSHEGRERSACSMILPHWILSTSVGIFVPQISKAEFFSSSNSSESQPRGLKLSPHGRKAKITSRSSSSHFHRWILPLKAPRESSYKTKASMHMNEVT